MRRPLLAWHACETQRRQGIGTVETQRKGAKGAAAVHSSRGRERRRQEETGGDRRRGGSEEAEEQWQAEKGTAVVVN